MLEKRFTHCGVKIHNQAFVFGGRFVSTAEVYDIQNDSWSNLPDMPVKTCCYTVAYFD
jgi:hypothetical protein